MLLIDSDVIHRAPWPQPEDLPRVVFFASFSPENEQSYDTAEQVCFANPLDTFRLVLEGGSGLH